MHSCGNHYIIIDVQTEHVCKDNKGCASYPCTLFQVSPVNCIAYLLNNQRNQISNHRLPATFPICDDYSFRSDDNMFVLQVE